MKKSVSEPMISYSFVGLTGKRNDKAYIRVGRRVQYVYTCKEYVIRLMRSHYLQTTEEFKYYLLTVEGHRITGSKPWNPSNVLRRKRFEAMLEKRNDR